MAFSADEKARLLFVLGYSAFEDDSPAIRAINGLDAKETTAGPIVRDLLEKIRQVDEDIHATRPLSMAIEDGSIKLRSQYTLDHLRQLGQQYVVRLARFTKIMIAGDIFGTGGNERTGDFYSGDPSEHRINPDYGVPTIGEFGFGGVKY